MDTQEIFKQTSERLIEGMMVHDSMASYYDFLGLKGYKRVHEYHFLKESIAYRKINRYYINIYSMLIPKGMPKDPAVIPASWKGVKRENVDISTKRNAVKTAIEKYVSWETETKNLYSQLYKELENNQEINACIELEKLIKEVTMELKTASRKHIELKSIDYDIIYISQEQQKIHDCYKSKMKRL